MCKYLSGVSTHRVFHISGMRSYLIFNYFSNTLCFITSFDLIQLRLTTQKVGRSAHGHHFLPELKTNHQSCPELVLSTSSLLRRNIYLRNLSWSVDTLYTTMSKSSNKKRFNPRKQYRETLVAHKCICNPILPLTQPIFLDDRLHLIVYPKYFRPQPRLKDRFA